MTKLNNLWVEKYRPQTLSDLCVSDELKTRVEEWRESGSIPNLMFIGPCGVGENALAKILVEEVLKCDYLYINASDENGVEVMRTKIAGFVHTKSFDGNLKVVVLDEADGITRDGQKICRNMMETFADNCRFILTGNYKHRIIEPLESRCQKVDIMPSLKDAVVRCLHILRQENVEVSPEQKKLLVQVVRMNYPDLRYAIQEIQKYSVGGVLAIPESGNSDDLCGKILKDCVEGNTLELREYLMKNENLFSSDWDNLMVSLLNHVYGSELVPAKKKQICMVIADHLEKSVRVIDKEINMFSCCLNIENC